MLDASALFTGRRLLILGVAGYLLFVLATFPARLAVGWLLPEEIVAANVGGTVWSGRAGTLVAPRFRLTETTWRAKPLALVTGRLRFAVNTHLGDGTIQCIATVFPGGAVELTDVAGVVPISALPGLIPAGTVDGRIGLDIERVRIENAWITDARGTADIVSLELLVPVSASLGSYELAFSGADDSGVPAAFRDVAGPIEADGTLLLLPVEGWKLDGSVRPAATASEQLRQALGLALPRNADGSYRLSFSSD